MSYRMFLCVIAISGVSFIEANAQLNEHFVPRSETFNGITYEDAVGGFMEWWFSFPSDDGNNVHPLLDADGSEMHINNDGPIYNLNVSWRKGNTLPASERDPIDLQEIRRVEVRSDQAIFAPLAGWIAWPLPTSNASARDPAHRQSDLNDLFDDTTFELGLTINGDEIEIDQSADSPFLIDTVHFDVPFPSDSAFNDVEGYQADDPDHSSRYSTPNVLPFVVNNNYMSLLKPLPVGEHTVELFGRNVVDGEVAFTTDIAYQITVTQAGDFNDNGFLDLEDINLLGAETAAATDDVDYDVTFDSKVDADDLSTWVKDLANTWIGDSNLDGEFNSSDFVTVFKAGKYEQDEAANWGEGDWNADSRFDSGDFVVAFQDGGYELGLSPATQSVPEPNSLSVVSLLLMFLAGKQACRRE